MPPHVRTVALSVAVAAFSTLGVVQLPDADLVIVNAKVFTGVPAAPWAEALSVIGDRIGVVGTTEAVRNVARPSTRKEDPSLEAALARLKAAVARAPKGGWIYVPERKPTLHHSEAVERWESSAVLPRRPLDDAQRDHARHAGEALSQAGIRTTSGERNRPHSSTS